MKNIKKSIVLASALFLTTGLYANCDQKGYKQNKECKQEGYKKHQGYNNHDKKERRSHRGDISRFFIGAVYNLDLTKEQTTKIDAIITEFKNKKFDKFKSFTKEGFDKQAYIDAIIVSKEQKVKQKADLIANIYKELNKKQIEQLNKKVEMFKERRMNKMKNKKRGNNDSSCNDRR